MRKKLFTMILIVVFLGMMMATICPVSATMQNHEIYSFLCSDASGNHIGMVGFDMTTNKYFTLGNVGELNKGVDYQLQAYNPSGIPTTITWGRAHANPSGRLRFIGKFDSINLAWINNYGLTGATFSVIPV